MEAITRDDIVVLDDKQVFCAVEDSVVVMNVAAGEYYDLNRHASDIWKRLSTPQRVSSLCAELCGKYRVTPERCEHDVLNLLNRLKNKGAISICNRSAN